MLYVTLFAGQYPARHFNTVRQSDVKFDKHHPKHGCFICWTASGTSLQHTRTFKSIWNMSDPLTFRLLNTIIIFVGQCPTK